MPAGGVPRKDVGRMCDVVRRVAVCTGLAVMLALGAATAADAKGRKDRVALPDDLAVFVLGNTIFTLFHELGHALVAQLELPVPRLAAAAVDEQIRSAPSRE